MRKASSPLLRGRRGAVAVLALVFLATGIRCLGLGRPLVGNFATKNIVYAMIARNWAEGRAGLWFPTLDCLRAGRRSLHMLELPISSYLTGWLWKSLGGSLDVWGRATSVVFSGASVVLIYLIVRRRHGAKAALGASASLALSPVSIIYGQNFMLEASLVFFTLAAVDSLDRWLARGHCRWLLVSGIWLALALLTKIYLLVLLLPLAAEVRRAAGIMRERFNTPLSPCGRGVGGEGLSQPRLPWAGAVSALAIAPAVIWYWHAARTAAPGSPLAAQIFYSVRESVAVHFPPHPILKSADFYRRVLDDLAGPVLTPVGLMLALAGFCHPAWRRYAAWLVASAVLVALLPLKFYEMNYYWMAVLAPLAILAGLGWEVVSERLRLGGLATWTVLLLALVFSLRYAVRPAFVTPEEDRSVVAAGQAVQRLTAAEERVVTVHGTTIDLVYYCNRPGWFVGPDDPDLQKLVRDYRRQGARYLVACGPGLDSLASSLGGAAVRQVQGDGFCVYRLP